MKAHLSLLPESPAATISKTTICRLPDMKFSNTDFLKKYYVRVNKNLFSLINERSGK